MTLRFPQPSGPSTPITGPSCSLISDDALYVWPTGANEAHYFVTGDTETSVLTRSAQAGASFNAATGNLESTSATGDLSFALPDSLVTWTAAGPFTLILLLDWDLGTGGPSSGQYKPVESLSGGGWGLAAVMSSGGGLVVEHYNQSPSWGGASANLYSSATGEKFITHRHTSGDQDTFRDATLVGSTSYTTASGATYNSATYPLKTGSSFYAAATRRAYWKGTIIVPGAALSDGVISNIVGASGLIVTSGAALTKKLKVLCHPDFQSAVSVKGSVFSAPSGSNLTGAKIGDFTGQSFSGTLESGQAVLKVTASVFGGSSLTTSDTPVCVIEATTDSASPLGNAVAAGSAGVFSCTVIEE